MLFISSAFAQAPTSQPAPETPQAASSTAPEAPPEPPAASPPAQSSPAIPLTPHPAPSPAERAYFAFMVLAFAASVLILWRKDIIRPGSFRRRGQRNPGPWPWWLWILCTFVVFFTQGAFASLAISALASLAKSNSDLAQAIAGLVGATAGAAAGILLLRLLVNSTPLPSSATGLGLRVRPRDILIGILALLAAYPIVQATFTVAAAISTLITGASPQPIAHETLRTIQASPSPLVITLLALVAVLGAPIVEEVLFRVFLQTAALRITRSAWASILITSALFALVHLGGGVQNSEAHVLAPLFVLGAAMGVAYERTRRIAVPIAMHMAFNAINLLILFLTT